MTEALYWYALNEKEAASFDAHGFQNWKPLLSADNRFFNRLLLKSVRHWRKSTTQNYTNRNFRLLKITAKVVGAGNADMHTI